MNIVAGLAMLIASYLPSLVKEDAAIADSPLANEHSFSQTTKQSANSENKLPEIQDIQETLIQPPAISPADSQENEVNSKPKQPLISLVFDDKTDDEVITMVVDNLEAMDTLNGNFYQQAPSGTLSTGKFYIRRPGLLRFEYDPPTPLLIVANGGTVFVHDDALKTTDSYPVGRTPLKFLLRKKVDLEKADIVKVERGEDAVAITLSARDEETEGELSLVFTAPEIELVRWVVRDARNGLTIVDLTDVVRDEKLNNSLFRIPETQSPFLKN